MPDASETSKWQQIVVQYGQYWTSSYYMGIGAIFLAVMALIRRPPTRVWMIGAILVGGMVLALGNNGYVFPLAKRLFPRFWG